MRIKEAPIVIPGLSTQSVENMKAGKLPPSEIVRLLIQSSDENPHAQVQKEGMLAYLDVRSRQVTPVIEKMVSITGGDFQVSTRHAPEIDQQGYYGSVIFKVDGLLFQSSVVYGHRPNNAQNRAGLTLLHHIVGVPRPDKEVNTGSATRLEENLSKRYVLSNIKVIYEFDKDTSSPYDLYEGQAILKVDDTVYMSHEVRERTRAQSTDVAAQDLLMRVKKRVRHQKNEPMSSRGKRMAPPLR